MYGVIDSAVTLDVHMFGTFHVQLGAVHVGRPALLINKQWRENVNCDFVYCKEIGLLALYIIRRNILI